MNGVHSTRLVVTREITERLRSRLIWVMTAVTTALVVGIIVIPPLVRQPAEPTTVGLVGQGAQALGPRLSAAAQAARVAVEVSNVATDAAARAQIESGTLDVALRLDPDAATAAVKESLSPEVAGVVTAVVDAAHQRDVLSRAGVPPKAIDAASTRVPLRIAVLEPQPADRAARSIAALAAGMLLYISLGMYATAVAGGVAQEKTSRTAEVLLAAVRPDQLLVGKVAGIGLCGLGQLAIAVVAGLIANAVVQNAEIPAIVWRLLPATLLWFALGFVLYGFAFAAAGALVARQEEVQFVTLPIAMPLIIGFLCMYAAMASPDAWWIRLLSFVPPLAPILMPTRLALGHMAAWEMPLGVIVMVASIYGMVRVAAHVYAAAIVHGGERVSWRAALRPGSG